MTEGLIESIKKISSSAAEAAEPVNIVYGSVISESPLEIVAGQKMVLDEKRLVLTENVKKTECTAEISWSTNSNGDHSHSISGVKKIIIDRSLKSGERVIMLKMQGGQKYIVLGRAVI